MTTAPNPSYVAFDEFGRFVDQPGLDALLASFTGDTAPTDVFVLAHGWNNNFADASQSYTAVLAQMSTVADAQGG
jgi:hypothetical protein